MTTTAGSPLEVVDADVTETSPSAGQSVVVSATIANRDDATESDLVELHVDGRLVATKGVRVAPGENETVTFEWSADEPGTYDLSVAGDALSTMTVVSSTETAQGETPTPPDPNATPADSLESTATGDIEVVDAGGLADWIREGFNASVRVTLANDRDTAVRDTVQVTVDGRPVANKTVVVPANSRVTESIEFQAVGGTVRVEDTEVGTLSVSGAFEEAQPQATTTSGDGPGFGVGTVVLAVLAVAIAALANRAVRDGE